MASKRKSVKSKFLSEEINEILNSSQCVNSPIKNKIPKLTHDETFKEDSKIKVSKTKRVGSHFDATQKIFNVMDHQLTKTKNSNENVLISLSDMVSQLQGDKEVLIANEQKLKQMISDLLQCIQQSKLAREQNLKKLEEVYNTYKNKVEGLLTRGAMKPDDRPLWFDVYRAFPPIAEPKFAKPKPEIKPIRQIFYKEDSIRAKFHSSGFGLGAVNLVNYNTDTQTKRLLKHYEKLKSENVPENELIEKSAEIVAVEKQPEVPKVTKISAKNPDSVTAQVLAEADLKNIFKE